MITAEIRPWTLEERVVCFLVRDGDRVVAEIHKPAHHEARAQAEAKVIAAAPKLLALLEKAKAIIEGDTLLLMDPELAELLDETSAAIAEAKGTSS